MSISRLIGAIGFIMGTTIGGAMLALPVITAELGLSNSLPLFLLSWFLMSACALLILEVNLWFPEGSHLVTMARQTLGPLGELVAWSSYLLLLYTLVSAYLTGAVDLLLPFSTLYGLSKTSLLLLLAVIFSVMIFKGVHTSDRSNRLLIAMKLILLVVLLDVMVPSMQQQLAWQLTSFAYGSAVMVVITSFGFAIIVPTLRRYLQSDIRALRLSIYLGSLIPLIIYFLWLFVVHHVLPPEQLLMLAQSTSPTSDLVAALASISRHPRLERISELFMIVCIFTSLLGVSVSLADFLTDGFQLKRDVKGKSMRVLLTLAPPLVMVLWIPNMFITGLAYAGVACVVLLVLLPIFMTWRGRYSLNMSSHYQLKGGKALLIFLLLTLMALLSVG